ncbi:hypothetical protein acsn021_11350 [Anaerocolumna cellulosilytica]|uniref:Uncharacterized protein n=1 Tax=Anaerocolumna cellulosilytica TaxID=433286 RepID=A0A6S6QV58_9FIRM|nr:hypothetical protein [Anaerocolumna cellulosilytica]MBB5194621.1 hypothetical protein [Anaerocolumna cellulosilytica]BCJ93566.1 hypothetical protein acsn021_11350 [Anaerocolumna cellulosilytica]
MYNTKLILADGREVYPGYLDKEKREQIKGEFDGCRGYMWCGCQSHERLFYRISEDLKLYPEHNKYKHDSCCSRYRTEEGEEERKTGYVVNDEDGAVTAYLTFNPKEFDLGKSEEKEEDNQDISDTEADEAENEVILEKNQNNEQKQEKKEPKLSLALLVRSINMDTYTERILNNKKVDSKETFSKLVYHRMKKAIGELSIEKDGVRFLYTSLAAIKKFEDKGLTKCYLCNYGPDGKIFRNFIFPDTLEKALKKFRKTYGIEPNEDTVMAGFQYLKKTKSKIQYKVLGRIHLFQVSNIGIYCNTLLEKETYDELVAITESDENITFWIPPDDNSVGGIVQIEGKEKKLLLLFRSECDEHITFNMDLYEPFVIGEKEPFTRERFYNVIEQME